MNLLRRMNFNFGKQLLKDEWFSLIYNEENHAFRTVLIVWDIAIENYCLHVAMVGISQG